MCYFQPTLKASTVHAYAQELLKQTLELQRHQPRLPITLVASVLLLAACWQTSLTAACRLVHDAPSHRLVRHAVYCCLPPGPRQLLARLLAAFRQTLPDRLRLRPHPMALDLHQRPYYGSDHTKGCTRRKKKAGTRKSFTYATLAVLAPEGRFTVGLLPFRPHMRWTTVVTELLGQAEESGLQVTRLLMDKEFYAAEVLDLLQRRQVPFLVAATNTERHGGGNGWLFKLSLPVGRYSYSWVAELRRMDFQAKRRRKRGKLAVTVDMWVARGKRRGKPVALVYATSGLGRAWSPAKVVAAYRRRFGIEVSYRQMGRCLARTSSRDERYRLLLVGMALLLANGWAYLHSEVFATGPASERRRRLQALRLPDLIAGVAGAIAGTLGGYVGGWPIQVQLPQQLSAWQT